MRELLTVLTGKECLFKSCTDSRTVKVVSFRHTKVVKHKLSVISEWSKTCTHRVVLALKIVSDISVHRRSRKTLHAFGVVRGGALLDTDTILKQI